MPNCLEFVPTQAGIHKRGAVLVQTPSRAGVDDLAHFLRESNATTLIYHGKFDETVEKVRLAAPGVNRLVRLGGGTANEAVDYSAAFDGQPTKPMDVNIGEDDLASIGFTSGSTGVPKGTLLTHRSRTHYFVTGGLEFGDIRSGEVFVHVTPLTHFTQAFVLPTMLRGGTNIMMPGFDVDALLETISRHKVTGMAAVPTILYQLLAHPRRDEYDLSSLRTLAYAGSPVAPEALRQALDVFGPILVQVYGGTEPGWMTYLRKEEHRIDEAGWLERLASAGRPMPHVDVCIQDDDDNVLPLGQTGEICARSAGQMDGYVHSERNTEAMRGGWVHSGDIGYIDFDGYIYIVDRKKDMIVTGGLNVFPRQVEDLLMEHPAVAQCAVIGVPHDKWGEAVAAFVISKPGHDVTAEELMSLVKEHKGSVWAPKTVDFVRELPLNASGKVDKKALRAPYWVGRSRQVG
jgi:acyl-CoA synthetase (AMP-forming)/AMP-acid ligase II